MRKTPNEKIQRIYELRDGGLTETKIAQHEDVKVSQSTVSNYLSKRKCDEEINRLKQKDVELTAQVYTLESQQIDIGKEIEKGVKRELKKMMGAFLRLYN